MTLAAVHWYNMAEVLIRFWWVEPTLRRALPGSVVGWAVPTDNWLRTFAQLH